MVQFEAWLLGFLGWWAVLVTDVCAILELCDELCDDCCLGLWDLVRRWLLEKLVQDSGRVDLQSS